ncbi:Transmembrane protein [Fasciola hepatica]|uniref:Transmembrane protein n=1 Tax=Fasciola hepatica TaxID=6192 RepID=A0A4E0QT91_FASHE|nr:Transmembrane protein [Fasciola hepatica]
MSADRAESTDDDTHDFIRMRRTADRPVALHCLHATYGLRSLSVFLNFARFNHYESCKQSRCCPNCCCRNTICCCPVCVLYNLGTMLWYPRFLIRKPNDSSHKTLILNRATIVGLKLKLWVNLVTLVIGSSSTTHERVSGMCDELFLAHIVPVDFSTYHFTVRFSGLLPEPRRRSGRSKEDESSVLRIDDVAFVFRYYNSQFTYMELTSRFVFFILTELIAILFLGSLRHFALRDWTIEQRCTVLLLPTLLFYNNPLYPLRFFTNSWIPQFMDYLFQITFLCSVLLFWLIVYHGLRSTKRTICAFYAPKVFLVLTLWLPFVGLSLWKSCHEYTDVTFNASSSLIGAIYLQAFLVFCALIYLLFLIVLIIRAFADLRKLPYYRGTENRTRYGRRVFAIRNTCPKQRSLLSCMHCDKTFSDLVPNTRFLTSSLLTRLFHPILAILRKHRWWKT